MLTTLLNAFKVKDVRKKLLYTFIMLVIIRFGSNLPIPGVNTTYFKDFFEKQAGDAFGFFNAITGGSFESLSVLALSITPYITSSIIIQLLTIAIPALEELQQDGEDGRKKIVEYTRYLTVALALLQSSAMAIGFGRQGLLIHFGIKSVIVAIVTMTAGSAFLMWIGERITENGVGNGISIVLLLNILASLPSDFNNLYVRFLKGQTVAKMVVAAAIIIAFVIAMVVFTIILQDAERRIPVQYSSKTQGRRSVGGASSNIPLKVNTAGVIPVIFASSIFSTPIVIGQFLNINNGSIIGEILTYMNSSMWFKPEAPKYSVGLIVYIIMIILFAYFYTSITFNPLEVANNMKKSGGFIPGIRPGRTTVEYLNRVMTRITFVGALFLAAVATLPTILTQLTPIDVSFGGTSLLIVVGVALDSMKQLEQQMVMRNYQGFLK